MDKNKKQSGISLMEILVVVSIMAILMGIAVPAAKSLMASFDSGTGVRQLINAALSNARAIAVREQAYAGVRFQQDANGNTYMILIQHETPANMGGLANGFRAVTGRKPMKLPEDVTVPITSVVFSSQGKLTIHPVWTRNKDGMTDDSSNDTIFNIQTKVDAGDAMFVQDTGNQSSVNKLVLVDQDGNQTPEYISPYTGELVMEYREQNP